jgi:2-phospho-L-lactate guanylyltransferase
MSTPSHPLIDTQMKLWLVVPTKPLDEGKSRLVDVLPPAKRAELNRKLLEGVLAAAQEPGLIEGVLVVSRDPAVSDLAKAGGAQMLREASRGLNSALVQARGQVLQLGANALLVLPADLPLITPVDVRNLVELGKEGEGIVIAPSRDGGTNALLLRPPDLIDFAFGPGSFRRHQELAAAQGHRCTVLRSSTLAYDVDWPEDLPLVM